MVTSDSRRCGGVEAEKHSNGSDEIWFWRIFAPLTAQANSVFCEGTLLNDTFAVSLFKFLIEVSLRLSPLADIRSAEISLDADVFSGWIALN